MQVTNLKNKKPRTLQIMHSCHSFQMVLTFEAGTVYMSAKHGAGMGSLPSLDEDLRMGRAHSAARRGRANPCSAARLRVLAASQLRRTTPSRTRRPGDTTPPSRTPRGTAAPAASSCTRTGPAPSRALRPPARPPARAVPCRRRPPPPGCCCTAIPGRPGPPRRRHRPRRSPPTPGHRRSTDEHGPALACRSSGERRSTRRRRPPWKGKP